MQILANRLTRFVEALIASGGSSAEEAAIVADHLVAANLFGHDSHGVGVLTKYVEDLGRRNLLPNRHAICVKQDGGILVYDGDLGYGQVVAREAMDAAVAHCKTHGLALLALRNCHHIGRVGSYGEQALAAGLVSISFVNVHDHLPVVAPHGGTDARFVTNPICIAIPGTKNRQPFLLDMATSKVAMGKVRVALSQGKQMPPDHLLDQHGHPTTDPGVMFGEGPIGALLALGGHKGYGLALAAELLAGGLSGGGTIQPGNPRGGGVKNNLLSVLIDPARLVDLDWFHQEFDDYLDFVQASPRADPDIPVKVAGDPERETKAERLKAGIPLPETVVEALISAGEKLGLARAQSEALLKG